MSTELVAGTHVRARITSQGQITVPKVVREALGARPGDDIVFLARGDEIVVEVRTRPSVLDFAGIAADAASRVPGTAEELDAVIDRGMSEAAIARATRR
jgi:antitoxin PrlF